MSDGSPPPPAALPAPNPDPHDWLQNLGIAIEIVCPALALIVTILRVYTRIKIKNYGWGELQRIRVVLRVLTLGEISPL